MLPFRGLRYAPGRVTSLAAVTSPPYDVLDVDSVMALEQTDPHNVVRLILPRDEDCADESRYEHAARTLQTWLEGGILVADPQPVLYMYEQSADDRVRQRGLLGAVGLRSPEERIVLPHEDVMPGPVADRLELMRAARANVEPILLMYDGADGPTAEVVRAVADDPPLVTATTPDGITHRLWSLAAADDLETVSRDLAGRQALIADGHHRYAAYRALQAEESDRAGAGPWDAGLALLVDLRAHPPSVGAIHRVVAGIGLDEAVAAAKEMFAATPVSGSAMDALPSLRTGDLLVSAAGGSYLLRALDPDAVSAMMAVDHPSQWGGLDTAVLHHVLVDSLWRLGDEAVTYYHDAERALRRVRDGDGVAVLLAPVTVQAVLEIAADGVRMPRKSTSFGPKPRTGLVLRAFEAG
jgi:uncharacterized protein (DUF1015 family)